MGPDGTRWDPMGPRWDPDGTRWDPMGPDGTTILSTCLLPYIPPLHRQPK